MNLFKMRRVKFLEGLCTDKLIIASHKRESTENEFLEFGDREPGDGFDVINAVFSLMNDGFTEKEPFEFGEVDRGDFLDNKCLRVVVCMRKGLQKMSSLIWSSLM